MSELRYPNESAEYRKAREALLKDEQELVAKVKAVAEKRRKLPPGGRLKQDYVFQWANDGKVGQRVKFSELFGDKPTLLLYSWMFGPNWDKPCPSCTSLMDGFDRTWYSVAQDAAFAAIAKAPAERIDAWARERGWSQIPLLSGFESPFQADYRCQGATDDNAVAGHACIRKARRTDFPFLGHRVDDEPRRHGVAVLESPGLHAGGPAGPRNAAAAVQVGVSGEELLDSEVDLASDEQAESGGWRITAAWMSLRSSGLFALWLVPRAGGASGG